MFNEKKNKGKIGHEKMNKFTDEEKIRESELEEKNKIIIQIKSKFSDVYQKFKEEMNRKIEFKEKKITKLKMIIDKLENELRDNIYTSNKTHENNKKEYEIVIFKQEEIIESLIKSKEDLNKIINEKDKQITNLKMKLKEEEIKNKKLKIYENNSPKYDKLTAILAHKNVKTKLNNLLEDSFNKENFNDISQIIKIPEVDYFKNLNKNLIEQIKGYFIKKLKILASEQIIKNNEIKMIQMGEELDDLKKLRQKFEKFENSYIQNFKGGDGNLEVNEKILNFEITVNEEEYIKENTNNIQKMLSQDTEIKMNNSSNKNYEGGISIIFENDEKNISEKL